MGVSTETIAKYYSQAFETFDKHRNPPPIEVSFYPYVGINHTIRIRNGRVFVRIAEICRDLPASAQRALALILVAKLYRRRVPTAAKELYGAAVSTDDELVAIKGGELLWTIRVPLARSSVPGGQVEKALGQPTTIRNHNTLQWMLEKIGD
jgi:hypothetical protein